MLIVILLGFDLMLILKALLGNKDVFSLSGRSELQSVTLSTPRFLPPSSLSPFNKGRKYPPQIQTSSNQTQNRLCTCCYQMNWLNTHRFRHLIAATNVPDRSLISDTSSVQISLFFFLYRSSIKVLVTSSGKRCRLQPTDRTPHHDEL